LEDIFMDVLLKNFELVLWLTGTRTTKINDPRRKETEGCDGGKCRDFA
jgi:hypothetical protein